MACVDGDIHVKQDRRITSADVARFGDDETVIYNFEDYALRDEMVYGQKDAVTSATNIVIMAQKNKSQVIAIDGDGMGGPVVDMVKNLVKGTPIKVVEINSAREAQDKDSYINARSEMWFYTAGLLAERECAIPNDPV